jgi:hypothetical protein
MNQIDQILNFYNKNNIIYGSVDLSWNSETGKKECKNVPLWGGQTESLYDKEKNSLYIITGKISGITVIDIDYEYKCTELLELCKKSCKLICKTRKGHHFYFKYTDKIKSVTMSTKLGYDIQSDRKIIYAPPSNYKVIAWNNKTNTLNLEEAAETFTYEFISGLNDPEDISDDIVNWIKKDLEKEIKPRISIKTSLKISEKWLELLNVAQRMNQSYETRLAILFSYKAMDNSEEMFNILDKWNKVDHPTYNGPEWISQWNNVKEKENNNITIASVVQWCIQNNPEGYKVWKEQHGNTDLYRLISNFYQANIAEYYSKKNKDNLIFNDGWFIYNETNSLWNKVDNDDLLLRVSEFMKTKLIKLEKYYRSRNTTVQTDTQTIAPNINVNQNIETLNMINKNLRLISGVSFLEGIIKMMKTNFKHDITMDQAPNLLSFSNGVYELDKGLFRKRNQNDYLTKSLAIEYKEVNDNNKINEIKEMINNEELLKYFGYCLTGLTKHRTNILINTGQAYTGKSTLALIYIKSAYQYTSSSLIRIHFLKDITSITNKL